MSAGVVPTGASPPGRAARLLAACATTLATLALLGWWTGVHRLSSLGTTTQEMVPSTALCLLLLSAGYLAQPRGPRDRVLVRAAALAVVVLAGLTLVELVASVDVALDRIVPAVQWDGHSAAMAPATAVGLELLGVATLVRRRAGAWAVQLLAVGALLNGYVAVLGYLYGASTLTAFGAATRMSLPTALSLVLLASAVLMHDPTTPLHALLSDRGSTGRLVRGLLPFLAVGPPAVGWLRLEGQELGYYDTRFGVGIIVTMLTVSTTALLLRSAGHVRRADAARDRALARLGDLNENLEGLVSERTQALAAARARFEAAFASSPLGTVLTSLDGRIEDVNRLLPELSRRPREQLLGTPVADLFDDSLAGYDEQLRADLLAGTAGSYALERRLRRDGAPCWVQVSVAVVQDETGGRGLIHQLEDITARRLAEDRAEHLALHDALTGLPNRVLLLDRLRQALAVATRHRRGVGVLFIDLDRFKVVNDSLGHHAGDLVLVEVAHRLRTHARAADTVARLGGDEFVVLMSDVASADDVLHVAGVLREVVARPMEVDGTHVDVDASVGIAFGVGEEDPETLLRRADQAMYRAKDRGRARAEVFDDDLRSRITQRLDTELALRRAVERGEIETWFQPIVDLQTEEVVAAEALVRWRRPDRGLVLPGEFIHVAEEVGLIKDLGAVVLQQAVAEAARLPEGPAVSVNVSARQFARDDFRAVVEDALALSGLPPHRLWLELTESALVEALDSAAQSFQALREQGVRIAVDDFGTGFSSFSQLRFFPVDLVKVDMTFVSDLTTSARDRAIVEGIVRMADALHLDVVGEGIETPEQRDLLRIFGCRYGQGYLYARPAPTLRTHERRLSTPPQQPTVTGRVEQG